MSNSSDGEGLMLLLLILTVVISIGAGVTAWDWVQPKSFGGAIGFLILWVLLSKFGHSVALFIGAVLFGGMK